MCYIDRDVQWGPKGQPKGKGTDTVMNDIIVSSKLLLTARWHSETATIIGCYMPIEYIYHNSQADSKIDFRAL